MLRYYSSVRRLTLKDKYTGVSVSGQSGYRDPPSCDSLKGQILSGQFDPRGLGIRTVRIPRPTVRPGIRTKKESDLRDNIYPDNLSPGVSVSGLQSGYRGLEWEI